MTGVQTCALPIFSHACFLITYPLAGWLGAVSLTAAAALLAAIAIGAGVVASRSWRSLTPSPVEEQERIRS